MSELTELAGRRGRVRINALLVAQIPETMIALRQMMQVDYEDDRDGFIDLVGWCPNFDQVKGFIPPYEAAFRREPSGELTVRFRRIG